MQHQEQSTTVQIANNERVPQHAAEAHHQVIIIPKYESCQQYDYKCQQ